ncbi:hypothetical protein GW15_0204125 [Xanthomonas axonopodis pv. vasculorum]|uniref:Uncharacterized protein n=1 Tax=Xanthomonas axonopodis pv. vasculorum TaxID=325777 RepID=A0A098Q1C5_9XANT|nr:hypothetical protein GW15_0204125 [Xanthomonas axonopodis pv. vasculorum]
MLRSCDAGRALVRADAHQWVIGDLQRNGSQQRTTNDSRSQNGILEIQVAIKRSHPQGFLYK